MVMRRSQVSEDYREGEEVCLCACMKWDLCSEVLRGRVIFRLE